jgi:hypothetical protein
LVVFEFIIKPLLSVRAACKRRGRASNPLFIIASWVQAQISAPEAHLDVGFRRRHAPVTMRT